MGAAMNHPLETEVKFFLQDREMIRTRIIEMGAVSRGRVFETNIRFEDKGKSLLENRRLLRLRQDKKARLTLKSDGPDPDERQYKVRQELEVEVSDFDTAKAILEALGFAEEQIYEKWRETLTLAQGPEFCLDTMPYGEFLEIEGEPDAILSAADTLGLDWNERILENYLGIFERIRKQHGLPFSDLTFENFNPLGKRDFTSDIRLFRMGLGLG